MSESRRMTLKRLAEELGVSPMTVSNAFNRPDQLSAALRERIVDHARERGYAGPDPLARGLRRGRAGAIGLISDTRLSYAFDDPAASAVMAALCAAAEEEELGLLLVPHGGRTSLPSALIDGIVVYSVAEDDPLLAIAVARRLPTVIIDQPTGTSLLTVGIDDERAAGDAARHLTAPRAHALCRRHVRTRPRRPDRPRRSRTPPRLTLRRIPQASCRVRRRTRRRGNRLGRGPRAGV